MNKCIALTLVFLILIASDIAFIGPAKAQYQGDIAINSDGIVSPPTAPIQQTSNAYSLISDIVGHIMVYASNIILDGSGHTVSSISLQGTSNVTVKNCVVTMKNQFTETVGIYFNNTSNSLIINNTITGFWSIYALNGIGFAGIFIKGGNANTFTENNLAYNLDGIELVNTSNNLLIRNNVISNASWSPFTTLVSCTHASNNSIYQNNFGNSRYQVQTYDSTNSWDNGQLGNYWSDYNGNGVYIIDSDNIDHYPLIEPVDISAQIATPTPTPSPSQTPSPSSPEFTARFVPSSLEVTIKNQPLTDYADVNGSNPSLYYGFRIKDHKNIQDWNYAPIYYVGISSYGTYYKASNSDYTVVSFPLGSYPLTGILDSEQVDLQVIALIGNEFPTSYENGSVYGFDGVTSGWSNVQTITIPISSNSPTQQPTPELTQSGSIDPWRDVLYDPGPFPLLEIILVIAIALIASIGVLLYFRRKKIVDFSILKFCSFGGQRHCSQLRRNET